MAPRLMGSLNIGQSNEVRGRVPCDSERCPPIAEPILSHHKKDWWARQDLNLGPTDYELS
jgi:hypothetical protein